MVRAHNSLLASGRAPPARVDRAAAAAVGHIRRADARRVRGDDHRRPCVRLHQIPSAGSRHRRRHHARGELVRRQPRQHARARAAPRAATVRLLRGSRRRSRWRDRAARGHGMFRRDVPARRGRHARGVRTCGGGVLPGGARERRVPALVRRRRTDGASHPARDRRRSRRSKPGRRRDRRRTPEAARCRRDSRGGRAADRVRVLRRAERRRATPRRSL